MERKFDFFFYSSPKLNVSFKPLLLVAETWSEAVRDASSLPRPITKLGMGGHVPPGKVGSFTEVVVVASSVLTLSQSLLSLSWLDGDWWHFRVLLGRGHVIITPESTENCYPPFWGTPGRAQHHRSPLAFICLRLHVFI